MDLGEERRRALSSGAWRPVQADMPGTRRPAVDARLGLAGSLWAHTPAPAGPHTIQ